MAKQNGFLKVEGTLGDISFYKNKDNFYIRSKGGVNKERIMNDPAFKRTRENGNEFGMVAAASKLLRDSNAVLIRKAYDGGLNQRLMQLLAKVKITDLTSLRGQRQVYEGLATAEGRALLKGFDFNGRSGLRSVLSAPYALDLASGKVSIAGLVPLEMLNAPPHATHVNLQSAVLHVDFQSGVSEVAYSPVANLVLDLTEADQTLTPGSVPAASGTLFYLLLVEFTQEVNGVQYALNNGNYNALSVLDLV